MARESIKGKGINNFRPKSHTPPAPTPPQPTARIKRTYYLHEDTIDRLDRVFYLRKLQENNKALDRSTIVEEALQAYLETFEKA